MAQKKPTVADATDYAVQLEALVEAAEESNVHPHDIQSQLEARARFVAAKRWD